ncbi:type III secretion system translocon subunit SctE [Serratia liquefaciens]|uniref:type III secretion system translocon subunit SctE n=1 Tax=Serratia liquefaciens TaxID=614 RepID=UPI002158964E|nr:type III secretion system translocon subunit SctE [Serratia liquefaciens]
MTTNVGFKPVSLLQHTRISPERAQQILTDVNKQQRSETTAVRNINVADLGETLDADVEFDHALLRESPVLPKGKLTRDGSLLLVLSTMIELQGQQAIDKLSSNLSSMQSMLDARKKAGEKLSAEAEAAVSVNEQALEEFKVAVDGQTAALLNQDEKAQLVKQAGEELKQLKEQVDPESDPAYQDKLLAAEKKLSEANTAFNAAKTVTEKAEAIALQKQKVVMVAQNNAAQALEKLNNSVDIPGYANVRSSVNQQTEKHLNNAATLSLLLGKFIQSVGDQSIEDLKNDMAITNTMREANQKDLQKKSEEFAEQQRKAEEASKATGCLGKVIGGIATAVGAVGLLFGGAGAGLMAVGIGLMVLDPIMEAVTGQSLTGMVLDPVMEHVFMPLMNLMSKLLDAIIDYTPIGLLLNELDKLTGLDITDMFKALAAAAATVAVFIAAAYVAKSAAKTMIDKMPKILTEALGKAVKDTVEQVSKAVPNMVKNGSKKVSQKVDQLQKAVFKNDPLSQEKWLNRLELTRNTAMVTASTTQAAGNIITGKLRKEAMDALADFSLSAADMEILKQLAEMVYQAFERKQELVQQLWGEMRNQLIHQTDTGRTIMRNLSASA